MDARVAFAIYCCYFPAAISQPCRVASAAAGEIERSAWLHIGQRLRDFRSWSHLRLALN